MDVIAEMLTNNSTYYYDRPSWHYDRPAFLEECINRCKKLHKNRIFLQKIGSVSNKLLESLKSFSQALFHYTDLASFQYGVWNKQKGIFNNFDLKILRRVTGISTYYFNRCIVLLKKAGYMTVYRDYKEIPSRHIEKGSPEYNKAFKSLPATRKISRSFFIDLGFNKERLESNQHAASNKRIDKIRKEKIKKDAINKPSSYNWFSTEKTIKDKNGKYHISKIKEIFKSIPLQESGP